MINGRDENAPHWASVQVCLDYEALINVHDQHENVLHWVSVQVCLDYEAPIHVPGHWGEKKLQ